MNLVLLCPRKQVVPVAGYPGLPAWASRGCGYGPGRPVPDRLGAAHRFEHIRRPPVAHHLVVVQSRHRLHSPLQACRFLAGFGQNDRGIEMITVPLAEAKNNLSKLVDDAAAGQVITIAKHGRALARLVPLGKPAGKRIGAMKGRLVVSDDFDAPLPDEILDDFEGNH